MTDAPHIMIVESRQYEDIADALSSGAVEVLTAAGATHERIAVPGAFEIPAAMRFAIRSYDFFSARRRFDGYIGLGCIIRGETSHHEHIARSVTNTIQEIACQYTLAMGYGIVTVENRDQVAARAAADQNNRGARAARACLDMIEIKRHFKLYPR